MTNLTHLNLGRKGRCPHRHWDILPTLPEDHPVPKRHKTDRGLVKNTLWHHYSFIGLLCHLRPHAAREREERKGNVLSIATLTSLTGPLSFDSQVRSKVS